MTAANRLLIDGGALVANWRRLGRCQPGAACGAAIKADGYGVGAHGVAARLADAGCRDFFVATWDEAEALGDLPAGALSVLHGVREADMAAALASPARPALASAEQVARWRAAGGGVCDIMVDTGLSRLGLTPEEALSDLLDGLDVDVMLSHLACADEPDHPLNRRQLAMFAEIAGRAKARRFSLANTAGTLLGADYGFDLVRPGIGLYGGHKALDPEALPVVRLAAEVLQVRDVPAGASVGYGATWTADRPTRVAILNLGYGDGVRRALAAHLRTAAGQPVIGRISMDLIVVAADADVAEGDWIELPFDLPALVAATGFSQYELLTGLGARFERRWL